MHSFQDFQLQLDRPCIGTFVKTDSTQVVEVLGHTDLDFLVLDAEHAPFDRAQQDRMLLAAHAVRKPMLVRIPDHRDATILSVLDLGAAGLVVPHVDSAEDAARVVAAARFVGGRRGLSLSARFGGYGTRPRAEAIQHGDRSLVVCQIESPAAVEAVDAIAQVPGVTALLVGRADLALAMGEAGPRAPAVRAATERVIEAARRHGRVVMLAAAQPAEVAEFLPLGVRSFIMGSDQSLLRQAASDLPRLLGDHRS